jgi:hypothetical protein
MPLTTSITRRYAMKPATAMPIITSASRTLTTAMMPSRRFVVPSSPDISSSLSPQNGEV